MAGLIPFVLLALVAGACLPTQAGLNAQLNNLTRSPVLAAGISFAVGALSLFLYVLILRVPWPAASDIQRYPWWIWSGGLLGALYVAATVVLAPKLGAVFMIALIIVGQMVASLLLDHFGLVGYQTHPITVWRVLGVFLMLGGVYMIKWV